MEFARVFGEFNEKTLAKLRAWGYNRKARSWDGFVASAERLGARDWLLCPPRERKRSERECRYCNTNA